jgi:hypothetical protein
MFLAACGQNTPGGNDDMSNGNPPPEQMVGEPGFRTVGRLNRTQYNHALRDVLGTTKTPADVFPLDETAHGFDNQGEALTTTSTHVELWELATDSVLDEMFGRNEETTIRYGVQVEDPGVFYAGVGQPYGLTGYTIIDGSITITQAVEFDGVFEITAMAFGRAADGDDPDLAIEVDNTRIGKVQIDAVAGAPALYTLTADVAAGVHTFKFLVDNPYDDGNGTRRNITIDWVEMNGPIDPEGELTDAYLAFAGCGADEMPDLACARSSVAALGEHLWRRPLTVEEVDWATSLYDTALAAGEDESWSLQYAFKGLMMSPEFLYHVEDDVPVGEPYRALDDYEVASRLSTFLWASTPDQGLLDAASTGTLLEQGGLDAQLDRMLADDNAAALVDSLANQWFDIDVLDSFLPDPGIYPNFDDDLSIAMQEELRLQTEAFFRGEEDLSTLMLREESYINGRLADHYQVAFPGDPNTYELVNTGRVGLIGSAGWLTAHSRFDAPSAVRRGKWVLENLLCSPPPPPPPDVEGSLEIVEGGGSIRQQEMALRADPYCQSCHASMDPMGYVLYGYDAIGHTRTVDELGYPIDTEVVLDGIPMSSAEELAEWVANDPRLPTCIVEKTMTWAVGRAMTSADDEAVAAVTDEFIAGGSTFRSLATAVVHSSPFLFRSAVPAAEEE